MKKNTGWTHFYEKKPVNFLRVMKLLFVLMTVTSLSISAKTFSQYRVTLDVRNVGVMELFKEIQKKTNLYFVLLTKQSPPFWPLFTKKETCFLKKQVSLFKNMPEI